MSEAKSSQSGSTDNDFDDVSSFSSVDSYKPEPFTGAETSNPENNKNSDAQSHESGSTLNKRDSNAIEKVVTHNVINNNAETPESLRQEGLNMKNKAIPDINAPLSADSDTAEFPEEYGIETETGLVKLKTLNDLGRNDTRVSIGSNGKMSRKSSRDNKSVRSSTTENNEPADAGGDSTQHTHHDAHNLEQAVEKNKHRIEKYEKHKHEKGLKGLVHRLFD